MNENKRMAIFECVEGGVTIALSDIVYIEAFKHKNTIHTVVGEYHIYESMNSLQSRLCDNGFIRVHRGYIVNRDHVLRINNYIITLTDGVEIPVSKTKYKVIRDLVMHMEKP